jgi:hypothetical protein
MTATCENEECDEYGIPKPMTLTLHEGDVVQCGGCGSPCVLGGVEARKELT